MSRLAPVDVAAALGLLLAITALWASDLAGARDEPARPTPKVECLSAGAGQTYKIAPKACSMYEHTAEVYSPTSVTSMAWRNWGKKRTRGRGIIHFYDHPEYSGRVLVRLGRVMRGTCVPGRYYTRARFRVLSGRADGHTFALNLSPGCPA